MIGQSAVPDETSKKQQKGLQVSIVLILYVVEVELI